MVLRLHNLQQRRAMRREKVFLDRSNPNPIEAYSDADLVKRCHFGHHSLLQSELEKLTKRNAAIPPV